MKNFSFLVFSLLAVCNVITFNVVADQTAHPKPTRKATNSIPYINLKGQTDTYRKGSKPNPTPISGRGKYAYKNIRSKDGAIRIDSNLPEFLNYWPLGRASIEIEKFNWRGELWKITWEAPDLKGGSLVYPDELPLTNEGRYLAPASTQEFRILYANGAKPLGYIIIKATAENRDSTQKASNIAKLQFHENFEKWSVLTKRPFVDKPTPGTSEPHFYVVLHSVLPDEQSLGQAASNITANYSFPAHLGSSDSNSENVQDALSLVAVGLTLAGAPPTAQGLIRFMGWAADQGESGQPHTSDFNDVWDIKANRKRFHNRIQIQGAKPRVFNDVAKDYYALKPFLLATYQVKWLQADKYVRTGYINSPFVKAEVFTGASHPLGHLVRVKRPRP